MRAPFSLSQFSPGGISRPGKPAPLPGNARELLPAGALRSNVAGTCGSPTNAPSKNAVQGFVIGSACAAAFFHRGIIPLLTLFFSASGSQKTAVTPLEEGRQIPSGLPPPPAGGISSLATLAVMRNAEHSFPRIAPSAGHKFVLNPCRRAAHRNYSPFSIHYSLSTRPVRRHTAPRQTHLLPGNARELLPAGALSLPGHGPCLGCVRVGLACPQILSANCSPQGLPYFMGI